MADRFLSLDAFIRSVGISKTPYTLFLGAGASITSGMPSAQMCIWEWKRDIFLTNNIGLETQFSEPSLASVRERIQRWLDRQGIYPAQGAPDEYGVYVEACYPIPDSRRAYFQQKVRQAKPHTGYQLLSVLAEHGLVRSVWTTNFDQLASRALANSSVAPIEVGIDSSHRILRPSKVGELMIVSLHGDYRYDRLKNTPQEIREQESSLEASFVEELRDAPAIVCGYSGRDESIMDAFYQSLVQSGSGSIYWCIQDSTSVAKPVTELIDRARAQGRTAYLVVTQGFDDLMIRLALHCLGGSAQAEATALIAKNSGSSDTPRAPFRIELKEPGTIIKSNAFEIDCPSEVLECELKQWPTEHAWRWVREQTASRNVVAVPFRGKIFALGTMDDLRACFEGNIKGGPRRTPLPEGSLRIEDGAISSLMLEALKRSMIETSGAQADHFNELWLRDSARQERLDGAVYSVYPSVQISLRPIENKIFLLLKPSVRVEDASGQLPPLSKANPIKLRVLGWQHNKEFNDAVNLWRTRLLGSDKPQRTYEYPVNDGAFRFVIRRAPSFAEVGSLEGVKTAPLEARFRTLIKQKGLQIPEPELVFSNRAGRGIVRDATLSAAF